MKTSITLALCSTLLLFSSCKKLFTKADGTDIAYAMKQGYLYTTWIINDDDKAKYDVTQNGHTYNDKKDPSIFIKRDNSYRLQYFSSGSNTSLTETGTYNVDADAKKITLHPSGKSDYTYKIKCLTEEDFTLVATFDQTIYIKNGEGILVPQTTRVDETLFMEDND